MRFFATAALVLTASCATSPTPVPEGWRTVPQAPKIADLCARVACAARTMAPEVHAAGGKLYNGRKELTPAFAAIQSFDVSLDRREVVFSARRGDNFDIGLVSLDGSKINWFPSERVDETDVQWAPRGNKVSYLLHAPRGDVVRTLHIPTSAQLSVDFPDARVDALAWDPAAERYAVVVESPDASQRVESAKYGGEERRLVVPPAARLDATIEPVAGAVVLRPPNLRYNEKLPLVVWQDADPLRWSDARAALMRNARVSIAVVSQEPDWNALKSLKWIDGQKIYAVGLSLQHAAGSTQLLEDPNIRAGFYRIDGKTVRARGIQSFAAGYIAHELNTNGFR